MRLLSRRTLLLSACAAAPGSLVYGRLIEPAWLEANRVRVPLPGPFPGGPVRLLHLSDFHRSRSVSLDRLRHACETGLAWKPDLICFTGDFVTGRLGDRTAYAKLLRRLSAAAPAWAVLGNHDGGRWAVRFGGDLRTDAAEALAAESGLGLLQNRHVRLEVRGQPLWLAGVGDMWSGFFDPELAFAGLAPAPEEPVLFLAHNPDSKDHAGRHPWHLMLSGHTHGGQIGFGLGRVTAPVVDTRYLEGLKPWNKRWVHVSRGVGSIFGIRLACRPQVTLLELVPAPSSSSSS